MIPEHTIVRPNQSRLWLDRSECVAIMACSNAELMLAMIFKNTRLWIPHEAIVQWLLEVKSLPEGAADLEVRLFAKRMRRVLEVVTDEKRPHHRFYRIDWDNGAMEDIVWPDIPRHDNGISRLAVRLMQYALALPSPSLTGVFSPIER